VTAQFRVLKSPLADLLLIDRRIVSDDRGYLDRIYGADELLGVVGGSLSVAQINHTLTAMRGTVRGMHFQMPPRAETKLVTCLRGEVFDVAVDLRRSSPTFLRWYGERLTGESHRTMLIPMGFAHGFQSLTDGCEMLYVHSAVYDPASEGGLHPLDPRLAITWPQQIARISARDASHPMLADDFRGLDL
jgi:dTDP-4-dehydrorhamnose 3,5-epimerase